MQRHLTSPHRRRSGHMFTVAMIALVATVAAAACGDDSPSGDGPSGASLDVVATTTVVADFARAVGGERVTVTGLLKPNVDAHDFDPSPADLDAIASADLIVINGLGLESWLDATLSSSGTAAVVVDASAGVELLADDATGESDHDGDHDHDTDGVDPHIWQDPDNAVTMVGTVADAFAAADPAGAGVYEANRVAYVAQLVALDAEITEQLAPITTRLLVTNHDAFRYFAHHYDFTVVGSVIPSFDTSAELSADELNDLVNTIRELGVTAVFAESSLPSKTARTIANEAGVAVVEGDDALYGDGLGSADSVASTYLTMMRHNSSTIAANLS